MVVEECKKAEPDLVSVVDDDEEADHLSRCIRASEV
jgi:hypothetical protein